MIASQSPNLNALLTYASHLLQQSNVELQNLIRYPLHLNVFSFQLQQ
jgi:hypothetical protein